MTISELFVDYKENEEKIRQMDFNNLSESDISVLMTYHEEKELFSRACDALDFTASSNAQIQQIENRKFVNSLFSLQENEEYVRQLNTLTNNMDKHYITAIYSEGYTADKSIIEYNDRQEKTEAQLANVFKSALVADTYQNNATPVITVAMLTAAIERCDALMAEHDIDRENIHQSSAETTLFAALNQKAYELDNNIEKNRELQPESLVLIESNDGYVLASNASPEMFREHPELENQYNGVVQNGNEVVHNEVPRETTVDMSKVSGHVKYEQFDDIGSIEKQQGIPDYETKEEMAVTTQKHSTENGKEKNEVTKSPKHKSADIER